MVQQFTNVLCNESIDELLQLQEVINARNKLNFVESGSEYFQVNLSDELKDELYTQMGISLDRLKSVPMRWIKGDTKSHIDSGISQFRNTYLVYLTDNIGELVIDNTSYSMSKGYGYVFSEGLEHKTVGAGTEPRLLIGPMSEHGFAVGGPFNIQAPGNSTVYIRENNSNIQYSLDQTIWNSFYFPCAITNTDPNLGILKVEFTTDISLNQQYHYFLTGSTNIQYGSTSLKNDGSRPVIVIDGVNDYPGLISNGDYNSPGYDNVYVYNLNVSAINGSRLYSNSGNEPAGWIGARYFCKDASGVIVNCSSDGPIDNGCGGIVGSNSATSGKLRIIGCYSTGQIGANAGGIVGKDSAQDSGIVECEGCWSTGTIGLNSGGIYGSNAGDGGSVSATNCYSLGNQTSDNAGGIFGYFAATAGTAIATNCYSRGSVGDDGGGIFGSSSASDSGVTQANNCYILGNQIYGANAQSELSANCYIANGSWSDSAANNALVGIPNPIIGTTWVSIVANQPYELRNMGYSPYTLQNIIGGTSPSLNRSFTQTITVGNSTNSAILNNNGYTILQTSPTEATITMNSTTGVITTLSNTPSGNYTLILRNSDRYITEFILVLQSANPIPCLIRDTTVLTPVGYIPVQQLKKGDVVITSDDRKVEIVNIFKSLVKGNENTYPCIIPKGSISYNYPPSDLRISRNHLIKYKYHWIHPSQNFSRDKTFKQIEYYHIQLNNYSKDHLVINNGIIVESLAASDKDFVEYMHRIKSSINFYKMRTKKPKNVLK